MSTRYEKLQQYRSEMLRRKEEFRIGGKDEAMPKSIARAIGADADDVCFRLALDGARFWNSLEVST